MITHKQEIVEIIENKMHNQEIGEIGD